MWPAQRYNLLTPEWAKRKFARDAGAEGGEGAPARGAATASPLGRAPLPEGGPAGPEDAATCTRPARRGNVARRLNIEQASRPKPCPWNPIIRLVGLLSQEVLCRWNIPCIVSRAMPSVLIHARQGMCFV